MESHQEAQFFHFITVLGNALQERINSETNCQEFSISERLKSRLDRAAEYFQENLNKSQYQLNGVFLILSGRGPHSVLECDLMQDYLKSNFGEQIPEQSILLENHSMNTFENCIYSYFMIYQKLKMEKLALNIRISVVTCSSHVQRTKTLFLGMFKKLLIQKKRFQPHNLQLLFLQTQSTADPSSTDKEPEELRLKNAKRVAILIAAQTLSDLQVGYKFIDWEEKDFNKAKILDFIFNEDPSE